MRDLIMCKDNNSTLRTHANKTCLVLNGQADLDQPNATHVEAIFLYNDDMIRESFCKFTIQHFFYCQVTIMFGSDIYFMY